MTSRPHSALPPLPPPNSVLPHTLTHSALRAPCDASPPLTPHCAAWDQRRLAFPTAPCTTAGKALGEASTAPLSPSNSRTTHSYHGFPTGPNHHLPAAERGRCVPGAKRNPRQDLSRCRFPGLNRAGSGPAGICPQSNVFFSLTSAFISKHGTGNPQSSTIPNYIATSMDYHPGFTSTDSPPSHKLQQRT